MKRLFVLTAVVALLGLSIAAQAVTIDTVRVGDPGNAADTRYTSPGFGSVSYEYRIGKYEVSAGQFTEFLNAAAATDTYGLYYSMMSDPTYGCGITRSGSSGSYTYSLADADLPVNNVMFWDACRFANWLNNGRGDADTETGAYTLTEAAIASNTVTRSAGAIWAVTSEDEWYKAAYYKGGGTNAGYWLYPTQSDSINTDMANYGVSTRTDLTDVGSYPYPSTYGTFDQAGNVWEWNESIITSSGIPCRGLRGGSRLPNGTYVLAASLRNQRNASMEGSGAVGFRVSYIPEPSPIVAFTAGLASLLGVWRRRA